ncbi:hypothetical protein ACF3OC_18015 [Sphingobacterium cellulitidis]|uniref:hypothetical protein n=1 Tax=Sphingobacterium cellulitidis TaxID=1768011 RepID=UPI00370D4CA1
MKNNKLRNKAVTLNFTEKEYSQLKTEKENSTCPNMALYLRKRLFSRKIVTTIRNRSQDDVLEELSRSRKCMERSKVQMVEALGDISESSDLLVIFKRIEQEMYIQTSLIKKLLKVWLH